MDAQAILITGRRGSGKSHLLKRWLAPCWRLVVFDPMGEHRACDVRVGSRQGLADALKNRFARTTCRIAVTPRQEDPAAWLAAAHWTAQALLRVQKPARQGKAPPITVAMDEAKYAYPTNHDANTFPAMPRLVATGRHSGIWLVAATQRLVGVNTELRGNTDRGVYLAQRGARDRELIAQEIGRQRADELARLSDGQALYDVRGQIAFYSDTNKIERPPLP